MIRDRPICQGPIIHLFTLETGAQDLYPDEFRGEEQLDRDSVANTIN